mgnify:CR=1 FL=1
MGIYPVAEVGISRFFQTPHISKFHNHAIDRSFIPIQKGHFQSVIMIRNHACLKVDFDTDLIRQPSITTIPDKPWF